MLILQVCQHFYRLGDVCCIGENVLFFGNKILIMLITIVVCLLYLLCQCTILPYVPIKLLWELI